MYQNIFQVVHGSNDTVIYKKHGHQRTVGMLSKQSIMAVVLQLISSFHKIRGHFAVISSDDITFLHDDMELRSCLHAFVRFIDKVPGFSMFYVAKIGILFVIPNGCKEVYRILNQILFFSYKIFYMFMFYAEFLDNF